MSLCVEVLYTNISIRMLTIFQNLTLFSIIAEAPPSYIQLFGKDKVDGAGRRRRRRRRLEDDDDDERTGHWRLLNLVPTDRKSAYRCGELLATYIGSSYRAI